MTSEEIIKYIKLAFDIEISNKTQIKDNAIVIYLPNSKINLKLKEL